ncbi:DUF1972 domain-containing protein [Gaoshiqia sediminis]|uniref:DUF1972 domain-containing protein n=1 Tax=Gaoshiqia sediminis TaxID=2986998 RepID=A0AA42C6N7_9BACT|nr:DUF1972 domain-containing protein [Gaoshiqia sediminis]MCW0484113.1 DUF1972 domain-containing protein [Gaoshiqia sediminis]
MNEIAFIGTAGIPSKYGGFETLAEYITKFLGKKIAITVFCSAKTYILKKDRHNHAQLNYINLDANGIQSIPYDIISLFVAARTHEQILVLGVSGCIILPVFRLFYPKKKLIINIDGLEHRREKWSKSIQRFLKFSEKLAVKHGNIIIADNKAIQDYVTTEYKKPSELIAYGGDHAKRIELKSEIREQFGIPGKYAFKVCRIEPENNIHLILNAFKEAALPLVLIGNWDKSEYGRNLKTQYSSFSSITLLDPIYDQQILDQIRSNCTVYVHGHSAGGTNPSLVEAMSLGIPVFAYDVSYNRETTFNKGRYFRTASELTELINSLNSSELESLAQDMKEIANEHYTWEKISQQYLELFKQ